MYRRNRYCRRRWQQRGTEQRRLDPGQRFLHGHGRTIPAGALQTDLGNSAFDGNASLKVGFTFPEPYCPVNFSSAVEPITRVLFDGIDNSSPATGGPAHQDFTSVMGTVAVGDTLAMRVEGNTAGSSYTTQIKVYIDWGQDGSFNEAIDAHYIGALTNSTGADGKFVTADITVPPTALGGTTRMRVTKKYGSAASSAATPCNTGGYGQAEDYTLTVSNGVVTHTVTPSVGTGDGTISPATAQTVNDGATTSFTLAADAGFHIDTVGGTCGGSLAGNVFTHR